MENQKIAVGAFCMWWDYKENAAVSKKGLPICPRCGAACLEYDYYAWLNAIKDKGVEGYFDFMLWLRGFCYKSKKMAWAAYNHLKEKVDKCPHDEKNCSIKIDCDYCVRNKTRLSVDEISISSSQKQFIEDVAIGFLKRIKKEYGGNKNFKSVEVIHPFYMYEASETVIRYAFIEYLKSVERK